VLRARLAPAMISTPGQRVPRRRQRGALPAWLPSGQTRAEPLRDDPFRRRFGTAQPVARARWRRCFALSLAFRTLARMAVLALAVFIADFPRRGPLPQCQWVPPPGAWTFR